MLATQLSSDEPYFGNQRQYARAETPKRREEIRAWISSFFFRRLLSASRRLGGCLYPARNENAAALRICFTLLMICVSSLAAPTTAPSPLPDEVLLLANFHGRSDSGLHFAWSVDGLKWLPVKNDASFLKPQVGSQKLMRDPCILQGPDGLFHMVWTTGWDGRDIGYASSKDLIEWSEQKAIPVMEHEPTAKNCWAPELVYDKANAEYIIFWATTIPGRFPETESGGDNNHRIYCTKTKDFQTFSKAELFFDPGFNVIDSTIIEDGGKFYMILKDETLKPKPKKHLRIASADRIAGPYTVVSEPFTMDWVEGPSAIKIGDMFYVYFDIYRQSRYGAMRSKDLKTWEDVTGQLELSRKTKHGTVIRVKKEVFEKMKS